MALIVIDSPDEVMNQLSSIFVEYDDLLHFSKPMDTFHDGLPSSLMERLARRWSVTCRWAEDGQTGLEEFRTNSVGCGVTGMRCWSQKIASAVVLWVGCSSPMSTL